MCNATKGRKTSFGIRIDEDLAEKLEKIVEESDYLNASRSEVVEAILMAYFKSSADYAKKARELIIQKKGKI